MDYVTLTIKNTDRPAIYEQNISLDKAQELMLQLHGKATLSEQSIPNLIVEYYTLNNTIRFDYRRFHATAHDDLAEVLS